MQCAVLKGRSCASTRGGTGWFLSTLKAIDSSQLRGKAVQAAVSLWGFLLVLLISRELSRGAAEPSCCTHLSMCRDTVGPCLSRAWARWPPEAPPDPSAAAWEQKDCFSLVCCAQDIWCVPWKSFLEKLKDLEHVTHVFKWKHCQHVFKRKHCKLTSFWCPELLRLTVLQEMT